MAILIVLKLLEEYPFEAFNTSNRKYTLQVKEITGYCEAI